MTIRGAAAITEERIRQQLQEGYSPEHDAGHTDASLTDAAMAYALFAAWQARPGGRFTDVEATELARGRFWPWDSDSWKPSADPVRNLVKAGALIAAEIDRLQAER